MKIAVNYSIFYQQRFGGISNYFFNLYKKLFSKRVDCKFFAPLHQNNYLKELDNDKISGIHLQYFPSIINPIIDQINYKISNFQIKRYNPDILHLSYYDQKKKYENFKGKKVCTVYDTISERLPEFFTNNKKLYDAKYETMKNCDHILSISETTKQDLIELFGINPNKISVTLLASSFSNNELTSNFKKKYDNCILFVGSRRGYKNFKGLLEIFSISKKLKQNFKIICYGGEKYSNYDKNLISKLNLDKNVYFFDDKTHKLKDLYLNVRCLIIPSLYEGFGLPLIEAMSLNCPVITSSKGSLAEVGGENCNYFNPYNLEEMREKIENFLFSSSMLNNSINYGMERSKQFSWDNCAENTLEVFEKL